MVDSDELEKLIAETGLPREEAEQLLAWSQPPDQTTPQPTGPVDSTDKYAANIQFLQCCFPDIPPATLRAKLVQVDNDTEKATDQLLNYEAVKGETNQYFDPKLRRHARNNAKQKNRQAKKEQANLNDIQTIQDVTGLSKEDAVSLYNRRGQTLSSSLAWYYRKETVHLKSLLIELAPKQPTAVKPAVDEGLDIDRMFAQRSIDQRSIATIRTKYEQQYTAYLKQVENSRRQISQGQQHASAQLTEASENAHSALEMLKELDLLAHRVAKYSEHDDVLDFHNMPVKAAVAVCQDRLETWKRSGKGQLYLITGAGRHSEGGVARIKPAIMRFLKGESIKFTEEDGALLVYK